MASLLYDGRTHRLTLRDRDGKEVGDWQAHNLVDSRATLEFLQDGTYSFQDTSLPHRHADQLDADTADGGFGPYGIFRIYYPHHRGIGIHSGRVQHRNGGPIYWTEGCIRTTDAAMSAISTLARADPLTTLVIVANYKETQPDAISWLHDHPLP